MAATLTASVLGAVLDRSIGLLSTQPVCDSHLHRHRCSRPTKCCLRHRLPVVAAVSATSNPAQPPDVWSTLREAAESAVAEAEILRRAFSTSAQEAFDTSRERFKDFSTSADLPGKVREIAESVNARVEEVAFDATREANRLDIQYRISERLAVAAQSAHQAAEELDCRYQLRQKLRQLQWETSYILILALRLLHGARQSPLFPFFMVSASPPAWRLMHPVPGGEIGSHSKEMAVGLLPAWKWLANGTLQRQAVMFGRGDSKPTWAPFFGVAGRVLPLDVSIRVDVSHILLDDVDRAPFPNRSEGSHESRSYRGERGGKHAAAPLCAVELGRSEVITQGDTACCSCCVPQVLAKTLKLMPCCQCHSWHGNQRNTAFLCIPECKIRWLSLCFLFSLAGELP